MQKVFRELQRLTQKRDAKTGNQYKNLETGY